MSTTTKSPFNIIAPIAERLVIALMPYCIRIETAGSIRRQKAQVGDIEIVAIPIPTVNLFSERIPGPTLLDNFLAEKKVPFVKNGDRYKQFLYGPYTVDLFLTTPECWGSVFTIRTGSAEFSKWIVTNRAARGASPEQVMFHEGRVYANGRLLATPEETDVFAALGLPFIPPADRTGALNISSGEPVWNYA